MELYLIMLHMADGAAPRRHSFAADGSGLAVCRETPNCWYLSSPPPGLPERYRKLDEYTLLNNKNAIYMFGRDSFRLVNEWNKMTMAAV